MLLLVMHAEAFADQNDVFIFDNGDQLTGEFRSLQRGKVNLKSYGASTISLHWEKIAFVAVDEDVLVETVTGQRYSGPLQKSETAGQVVVVTGRGPVSVDNDQIHQIFPLDVGGLKDLTITASAGYNFAKASSVQQANIGITVTRRTTSHIVTANYQGNASDSADNDASERRILTGSYSWLLPNRWLTTGNVSLDSNTELGIDLRSSVGGGFGRILAESDHSFVTLEGGLLLTRENLAGQAEKTDSVESYIAGEWDWYKFADPNLDWSSKLLVIPSITESGRIRANLDASLSWKIIGDLRWLIEIYTTYDNKPQTEGAENTDYGLNTSVSYRF